MITDTDANIQEACFHNGERYMKDKVISVLMDIKTQVSHPCHVHVGGYYQSDRKIMRRLRPPLFYFYAKKVRGWGITWAEKTLLR